MSTKLNAELRKKKSQANKEAEEINSIINDTEQLLLADHKEDEETKRALGVHRKVSYESEITETTHRLAMHDKIYKKDSFTGAFIKQLCNKYDLRILQFSEYTGKVPPEVYRKVREFADANKDKKVRISDTNWYILAPVEMFETRKVRKILDKDPILFYKEDGNGSHEREIQESDILMNVYSWGNDFSPLRQLRYLVNEYSEYSNDGISNRTRTIIFGILFTILGVTHLSGLLPSFGWTMGLASLLGVLYFAGTMTEEKIENLWNKDIR